MTSDPYGNNLESWSHIILAKREQSNEVNSAPPLPIRSPVHGQGTEEERAERAKMPESFVDLVREAMESEWLDYVHDSHCHPGEFEIRGKELWADFKRGGNWSRWVAQRIWSKARSILSAADAVLGREEGGVR